MKNTGAQRNWRLAIATAAVLGTLSGAGLAHADPGDGSDPGDGTGTSQNQNDAPAPPDTSNDGSQNGQDAPPPPPDNINDGPQAPDTSAPDPGIDNPPPTVTAPAPDTAAPETPDPAGPPVTPNAIDPDPATDPSTAGAPDVANPAPDDGISPTQPQPADLPTQAATTGTTEDSTTDAVLVARYKQAPTDTTPSTPNTQPTDTPPPGTPAQSQLTDQQAVDQLGRLMRSSPDPDKLQQLIDRIERDGVTTTGAFPTPQTTTSTQSIVDKPALLSGLPTTTVQNDPNTPVFTDPTTTIGFIPGRATADKNVQGPGITHVDTVYGNPNELTNNPAPGQSANVGPWSANLVEDNPLNADTPPDRDYTTGEQDFRAAPGAAGIVGLIGGSVQKQVRIVSATPISEQYVPSLNATEVQYQYQYQVRALDQAGAGSLTVPWTTSWQDINQEQAQELHREGVQFPEQK